MDVSYNQIQELTGMSYRTVKKRLNGLEPVGRKGRANVFDSSEALRRCYAPYCGGDKLDPQQEKAQLDRERRIGQKMKNRELDGELVQACEVDEMFFNLGRRVRDSMLSIPNRIDSQCAALSEKFEINKIIKAEIQQALVDFCKQAQPKE